MNTVNGLTLLFVGLISTSVFAKSQPIKVGSSPVLSSAGIYLALDEGFFKEQGLEVEVIDIPSSGGQMTLLLSKGELDVGAGNLTSGLFTAIAKDKSVKLVADKGHVAPDRDYIALIVRQDHVDSKRFKTLADLKGFKMGLTSLDGVSQQIVTEKFLKKASLTEKDIEYVKVSYAEMNTLLKSKNLDATIQLEPFVAQAQLGGFAKRIAGSSDVHPGQQSAAVLYSTRFSDQRFDDAVKFMAAYLKGVQLYNESISNPEVRTRVRASLGKRMKISDEKVWDAMTPIGLAADGRLNVKALQEDLDWYKNKGYLAATLKADSVIDHRFVDANAKQLNGKRKARAH